MDALFTTYQQRRRQHWERVALDMQDWRGLGGYYHHRLAEAFAQAVPPGQRVLEIGCGQGDLLAALKPALGVGVDFSANMLRQARARHPGLHFLLADGHELALGGVTFDAILLSDLLNDVWDVQTLLAGLLPLCGAHTRVVINLYSRLWEAPLSLVKRLKLARPVLYQNWLTRDDLAALLTLAGFEVVRGWHEVLFPLRVPLLSGLCNRFLARLWPFNHLAATNFTLARPAPRPGRLPAHPLTSIIIPARNEAGNIEPIFQRLPELPGGSELVFVEGGSSDDTFERIRQAIAAHPERRCQLVRQTGVGKGDAVRLGFGCAEGEVLMIFDADLTVPPASLPRFYEALVSGKGDFINGVRLVYPLEKRAMRFANLLGNKFFSLLFTWLLGQPVKDTLCGTKVLWKQDYQRIAANRAVFGDFDPFGDFDLLFGAARLGLKILDLPIRYQERVYGETNIQRWKHGWLLIRMAVFAAGRIKFV